MLRLSNSDIVKIIKQISRIRQFLTRRMRLTNFIQCVHQTFTHIGLLSLTLILFKKSR